MSRALIVDLGVGNLGNLVRALERVGPATGSTAEITTDPARVAAATCLLLPGVGAFAPPREALRGPLEVALRTALDRGAFLLGICVGFQLLFEAGEEFETIDGLGLLPGRVTRLPGSVPVPHIGWNRLHGLADHPLVSGLDAGPGWGEAVYFVHSFAPEGVPVEHRLALCTRSEEHT
ncbi:MAG TPA: imidazole glycerol phosphate synthase subunit HisH, partial [Acidobacteria bacterium]|nr:imidazole glycerol phosphate synthase subunit HisH [Acidobacteriota bacterium]